MDLPQFTSVIDRFSRLELSEAEEINRLRSQAPYCQIFPVMIARYAKEKQLTNHQHLLQLAAVWATDRSVLRELMLADDRKDDVAVTETIRRVDLADEIIKDLKRLQQLKLRFEELYDRMPSPGKVSESPKKKSSRLKSAAPPKKVEDAIITEIKSRKKLKPATPKQKAQLEVIDEFIRKKPTIAPVRSKSETSDGVAELEKPSDFSEAVISETLVDILIKQEKKEKAIDVLKKLIWKFPQKKAYFAAKIDELRK